ncbi:hypothetical protein ACHAXT_010953 [Thalassiosira profunda]
MSTPNDDNAPSSRSGSGGSTRIALCIAVALALFAFVLIDESGSSCVSAIGDFMAYVSGAAARVTSTVAAAVWNAQLLQISSCITWVVCAAAVVGVSKCGAAAGEESLNSANAPVRASTDEVYRARIEKLELDTAEMKKEAAEMELEGAKAWKANIDVLETTLALTKATNKLATYTARRMDEQEGRLGAVEDTQDEHSRKFEQQDVINKEQKATNKELEDKIDTALKLFGASSPVLPASANAHLARLVAEAADMKQLLEELIASQARVIPDVSCGRFVAVATGGTYVENVHQNSMSEGGGGGAPLIHEQAAAAARDGNAGEGGGQERVVLMHPAAPPAGAAAAGARGNRAGGVEEPPAPLAGADIGNYNYSEGGPINAPLRGGVVNAPLRGGIVNVGGMGFGSVMVNGPGGMIVVLEGAGNNFLGQGQAGAGANGNQARANRNGAASGGVDDGDGDGEAENGSLGGGCANGIEDDGVSWSTRSIREENA